MEKSLVDPSASCLIGHSPAFLEAKSKLDRFSKAAAPLLISGESGTGKEMYARAVHYLGPHRDSPFVPVNCGMLTENLLENELFGHERGAYTDAHTRKEGLIKDAAGGTLFLDEIDSLSPLSQVKLLRFIEDCKYRMLGSSKFESVEVRIISAANVSLPEQVHQGRFREDFYFRLAVLQVNLPPLRDREGDIIVLASHFLNECARKNSLCDLAFSAETLHALQAYHWPGNVRELKNVVERAAIMAASRTITAKDLEISSCNSTGGYDNASFAAAKHQLLDDFERTYLESLLERNGWNVSRVSQIAGIDRKSIQRLMKKHRLQVATFH